VRGRRAWILALLIPGIAVSGGAWWFWLYGPCGIRHVAESRTALSRQADRWSDAVKLAAMTPAMALSGPVSKLQDYRRETKETTVSPCAGDARDLLSRSMEHTIAGFLAFMGARPEERAPLTQQSPFLIHAVEEMEFFREEMGRLEHCAPACARDAVDWNAKREARENARRDAARRAAEEAKRQAAVQQTAAVAEAQARQDREREAKAARAAAEGRALQEDERLAERQRAELVVRSVAALKSDSIQGRAYAAHDLGQLAESGHRPKDLDAAVPALIEALSDATPMVRGTAATALGKLGASARAALEKLDQLANNDPAPGVRRLASEALQEIRGQP
jgi:hypothetical protein